MSTFSKRAKAEAAKYKHMINPKFQHKYDFGCGANKEGGGGFQPGNTCSGGGDGKDDAGDQDGGDKATGSSAAVQKYKDRLKKEVADFGNDPIRGEDHFLDKMHAMMKSYASGDISKSEVEEILEDLSQEITSSIVDNKNLSDLDRADFLNLSNGINSAIEESMEPGALDFDTLLDNLLPIQSEAAARDVASANDLALEQSKLDAEIADLKKQIAEQKSAGDAEINEQYKDITEEDIQDMLDEKDITAADAEEMRGWVAQAQEAQSGAPAAADAGAQDGGWSEDMPQRSTRERAAKINAENIEKHGVAISAGEEWVLQEHGDLPAGTVVDVIGSDKSFVVERSNGYVLSGMDEDGNGFDIHTTVEGNVSPRQDIGGTSTDAPDAPEAGGAGDIAESIVSAERRLDEFSVGPRMNDTAEMLEHNGLDPIDSPSYKELTDMKNMSAKDFEAKFPNVKSSDEAYVEYERVALQSVDEMREMLAEATGKPLSELVEDFLKSQSAATPAVDAAPDAPAAGHAPATAEDVAANLGVLQNRHDKLHPNEQINLDDKMSREVTKTLKGLDVNNLWEGIEERQTEENPQDLEWGPKSLIDFVFEGEYEYANDALDDIVNHVGMVQGSKAAAEWESKLQKVIAKVAKNFGLIED